MGRVTSYRNRSIFYLALLSLLYYSAFTLYPAYESSSRVFNHDAPRTYIEVVNDGASTVFKFNSSNYSYLEDKYNIPHELRNGDKIIISDGLLKELGGMSGIKKISLDIPIGINSAGVKELSALPGVGEVIAERIVKHRETNGKFVKIEELKLVEGIGDNKYEAIKSRVSLD